MDFLGMGAGEILVIMVVVLILFGPAKIPEIARGMGKTVRSFRKATQDLGDAVNREVEEEKRLIQETKNAVLAPPTPPGPPPLKAHPEDAADPGANI